MKDGDWGSVKITSTPKPDRCDWSRPSLTNARGRFDDHGFSEAREPDKLAILMGDAERDRGKANYMALGWIANKAIAGNRAELGTVELFALGRGCL